MKKIKQIVITLILTLILVPHQTIQALTSDVSIVGNKTLSPGEKGSYTITFNSSDTAYFSYKITGTNLSLAGSLSNDVFGDGEQKSASVKITAIGGSVGTNGVINVTFTTASTYDGKELTKTANLSIPIANSMPSTNTPGNSNPSTSKPNIPTSTKPGLPQLDNTEGDKAAVNASPEEKAKLEAERKQQELEALKTVPLISGIEVISQSEKYQGQVLETLTPVDNVFDYSYTLPKRINEFSLKVNGPEDVTLTYDETFKFEAEETEKIIVVKASRGEIDQSFNVLVKQGVIESVEKTIFDSSYTVYDDERLDSFIETIGAEKVDGTHFKLDNLRFQLVVNADNKAQWLLLKEDLSDQEFGLMHLNAEGELLFILESDDMAKETLYGEKYSDKELVIDERIASIDPTLTFDSNYKGINFEKGVVVYAVNSKGIKDNHFISDDSSFAYAVVAFDQVNMTYKYVAWGASVVLIALLGALLMTKVLNRKKSI